MRFRFAPPILLTQHRIARNVIGNKLFFTYFNMDFLDFKKLPKKWTVIILIIVVGFLLPILAATIQGRIVHFNPLAIVSTKNDNLTDCLVEATFQDSFSGRKFAGIEILFVRRYDVVNTRLIRPYYWFNLPGQPIKVMLRGETSVSRCESNPNYDPL